MADLYRILETYGARDIIAVEDPADAELEGINAATLWTRSLAEVLGREHHLDGVHDTLKIPKAILRVSGGGSIMIGSVFDGRSAEEEGVSATVATGVAQVYWSTPLGAYAAAALWHDDWGTMVVGSVTSQNPTSCEVGYDHVGPLMLAKSLGFALLLWW